MITHQQQDTSSNQMDVATKPLPDSVVDQTLSALLKQHGVRVHPKKLRDEMPKDCDYTSANDWYRALSLAGLRGDTLPIAQSSMVSHFLAFSKAGVVLFERIGEQTASFRVVVSSSADWIVTQHYTLSKIAAAFESQILTTNKATTSDSSWLKRTLNEVKPWYRDLIVASFAVNVLALFIPLFTMNVYDRVVPNHALETLWVLVVGIAVVIGFEWLLKQARSTVTDTAGQYLDNKLSAQLYQKVLGMKLSSKPSSSGMLARQIQDFDSVKEFFTSATLTTLVDIPFTLCFLALIAWLGGPMVWIPIAAMVLVLVVTLIVRPKLAAAYEQVSQLSMHKQGQLFSDIANLAEIKQFNARSHCQQRWENASLELSQWQTRSRRLSNLVGHTIQSSQQLVTVGLIVVGVHQIIAGALTMGGLIAVVMLSGRSAMAVNQISSLLLRYHQTKAAIDSVSNVMALEQESTPSQVLTQGQFEGSVTLSNVQFAYPNTQTHALHDLTAELKSGRIVGVVGPSGAGKSTLLSLLAGQLTPQFGQLNFDGVDLRLWPLPVLREGIGWVGQSPLLVNGTVYDNIVLGATHVDAQRLNQAITLSGLAGLMNSFDKGLETVVGELGRSISGGQRQAIALCRALYAQPKLLLLDEPSSFLDKRSEGHFTQQLRSMCKGASCVIASHNTHLLEKCDEIWVMDQGKIVASGAPAQILNLPKRSRVKNVSVVSQEVNHGD